MPGSSQTTAALRPRPAPRDVTVRAWPLAHGDRMAVVGVIGAALVFATAAYASRSAGTAAILAALVLLALWRLYLPVQYELSAGGITRTVLGRTRRVPWSGVGAVSRRESGVVVLRDWEDGPLALLRGIYIPYNNHKSDVQAVFDFYLAGRADSV